ncbi:hypothetical protein FBUS_05954 [Fasciolopsis buskii]|uniref:CUB domain-containing protein n=1 Tax=Fasciolopsis buskii TaxID=27845 RepID=A0A8E0VPW6_9TREM|nr:hypothetical protein FBUS_05954 [Fasciolopsis buski]
MTNTVFNLLLFISLYSATQSCSYNIEVPNSVQTLQYPTKDAPNTQCLLKFTALNNNKVKVTFTNLTNMSSDKKDCSENFVKFADEENELQNAVPYCAEKLPPSPFESKGNKFFVQYQVQDNAKNNFTVQLAPTTVGCGLFPSTFDGTEQVFKFPAPNQPVNLATECTYKTTSSQGLNLTAKITDIKLGTIDSPCTQDYVVFGSTEPPNDYTKCGTKIPEDNYTTTGSTLYWKIKVTTLNEQPSLTVTITTGTTTRGLQKSMLVIPHIVEFGEVPFANFGVQIAMRSELKAPRSELYEKTYFAN